ncbi:GIY-YIG nuclease [Citromicrobium phage vB_CbaS-RXM]|nr:GIY-YIG nuclease [Citromicrobium phage vB_CbaS-RXM]
MKLIYAIEETGMGCIKIGVTSDPIFRINALRTSNPFPLRFMGVAQGSTITERFLHTKFAEWRLQGEWFLPSAPVFEWVSSLTSFEDWEAGKVPVSMTLGEDDIAALYDEGWTLAEIGKRYHISRQAVQQMMQRMGKNRRDRAAACQARNLSSTLKVRLP